MKKTPQYICCPVSIWCFGSVCLSLAAFDASLHQNRAPMSASVFFSAHRSFDHQQSGHCVHLCNVRTGNNACAQAILAPRWAISWRGCQQKGDWGHSHKQLTQEERTWKAFAVLGHERHVLDSQAQFMNWTLTLGCWGDSWWAPSYPQLGVLKVQSQRTVGGWGEKGGLLMCLDSRPADHRCLETVKDASLLTCAQAGGKEREGGRESLGKSEGGGGSEGGTQWKKNVWYLSKHPSNSLVW